MADNEILIFAFEIGEDEVRTTDWNEVRSPKKEQANVRRRWFSEEVRNWLNESGTLPALVCDV